MIFAAHCRLAAAIFERGDYKYVAGDASEEIFWLLGPKGLESYHEINESEPKVASKDLADGGYCVMRDGFERSDNYMIVDCGEVGSLSGGHGHADAARDRDGRARQDCAG